MATTELTALDIDTGAGFLTLLCTETVNHVIDLTEKVHNTPDRLGIRLTDVNRNTLWVTAHACKSIISVRRLPVEINDPRIVRPMQLTPRA